LSEEVCEYPRIDERYAITDIQHGYFASGGGDPFQRAISHYNFTSDTMTNYSFGAQCSVHEPVFVPETAAEGEGYILSSVYDELGDHSRSAVFNAQNIAAGPIAHAMLEHRVPVSFHGIWIAAQSQLCRPSKVDAIDAVVMRNRTRFFFRSVIINRWSFACASESGMGFRQPLQNFDE